MKRILGMCVCVYVYVCVRDVTVKFNGQTIKEL